MLDAVRRYPVKSLRGEPLDRVDVARSGVPGDRVSALIVRTGSARVGKTYRGKEARPAASALRPATPRSLQRRNAESTWKFESWRTLFRRRAHFAARRRVVGRRERTRRLSGLSGNGSGRTFSFAPHAEFRQTESELVDAMLQLGTVRLRVRSSIERCVTMTYHPNGEPSDPRILRYLAQRRNAWMGIYCDVLEPGIARVGDALLRL